MASTRTRPWVTALPLLLLGACGGGGGGGSTPPPGPLLVSASFYGASGGDAVPAAGKSLRLSFAGPVTIAAGTAFTDAAVAFSGTAGSLGTGPLALARLNPMTLAVTLGAGAAFTPGTTLLDLAAGQAVILGPGGAPAQPGAPATIQTGTPELTTFTIAAIPDFLNGRTLAPGTLLLPQRGFPLDLAWQDRDGGTVAAGTLVVGATVPVVAAGAAQPAGTNLAPFLDAAGAWAQGVRLTPGTGITFPAAWFVLWGEIRDDQGKPSPRAALEVVAVAADAELRPFEPTVNPQQVWHLDLTRDRQTLVTSAGPNGTVDLTDSDVPNGTPDFHEDLLALGLRSANPLFTNLGDGTHPNDLLERLVKEALQGALEELFAGTPVAFTFTAPGAFPAAVQTPYGAAAFSRIAVGGGSESFALGLALLDERNQSQDDDAAWPGSSPAFPIALGAFPAELFRFSVNAVATVPFRATFDSLIRFRGTPAGEGPDDLSALRFLAGLSPATVNPGRTAAIENAAQELGRFLAVVLAHETGHSMGLVQDGAPPVGLHGNAPAAFPGSDGSHIDLTRIGVYPANAQNVMAPGISFLATLSPQTGFNALNLAWLREQVLYAGGLGGRLPAR